MSDLVTFRGGFVASMAVVQRLIDLQERGCAFELQESGSFRVVPVSLLNEFDVRFLRDRQHEVRQVLEYEEQLLRDLDGHQPF